MPRPPATAEQRAEQRERIRQAAGELYAESGIAAVSVRAVANRAGTSQGTIYSYFTNLGELLRSLWAEPVAEADRGLEQVAASIVDPIERIRALMVAFIDFVVANPDLHRGAMLFVRPSSQPTPDHFPAGSVTFYRLLTAALEEARDAGTVSVKDPERSAELLWAGLHGAMALPVNADIFELSTPETLAHSMIDLLLEAIAT